MENKIHPEYKHLTISSDGLNVYSSISGRNLKIFESSNGYLCVVVTVAKNKTKICRVHRLVAETFLGFRDKSWDVHHKDHNKKNNNIDNLMWCSRSENILAAIDFGVNPSRGETHPQAVHTEEFVHKICSMLQEGYRSCDIINLLGVDKHTVAGIKNKRNWRHISCNYKFSTVRKKRISLETVHKICSMLQEGCNNKEISKITGVKIHTIDRIARRECYKDISKDYVF